ncbi:MAG: hypothetical protein ISEC1_P0006 [Thiomicrorhabdus sp.]|nr:MAG: hypothetical protein ISEC1_P0006 [Thiomicrorhabdus sp.]
MSAIKPMYDVAATKVIDSCYYILAKDPEPMPENYAFFNNPGFIVTSVGVVVDTGSSVQIGEMVLRQIKKATDQPVIMVINTHYHGDHFLGNHDFVEAYPQADIYSHPAMIQNIKSGGGDFWLSFMQRNSDDGISGTIISLLNKTLNGGEVLKVGDTAMRRVANMVDGSFPGTIEVMKKAQALRCDHYIVGHALHDNASVCKDMQSFCENIYDSAVIYCEEGLSDFEMKPKILAQPFMKDVASHWPGFDKTVGVFIATAVAEVEENMC